MFMRSLFILLSLLNVNIVYCQDITTKLSAAMDKLVSDSQMKYGIISLYVVNSKTGEMVYDKNGNVGLAGASTQKVITSSTAFELLGHDYAYKTSLAYDGSIKNKILDGNIIISGSGDPSLGSWRYSTTKEDKILNDFKSAILKEGIHKVKGTIYASDTLWRSEIIPPGWIWEDLGSYYGAGAGSLNWRENQYDLIMRSGNVIGDTVQFVGTSPQRIEGLQFKMYATAAEKGTGDRSYIYIPSKDGFYHVRGSIPINENHFVISGALIHPDHQLSSTLLQSLPETFNISGQNKIQHKENTIHKVFYTHISPPLDSLIYWFLKKSINLYGEALVKTIAFEKTHVASTDSGANIIKKFWQTRGIDPLSINIKDGSGLSPGNRITTNALVSILQYGLKQTWFESFLNALPEINGLKMKSGTIADVLAYAGFAKSTEGKKYTFAMIINNYNGSPAMMRQKMWRVLDNLK